MFIDLFGVQWRFTTLSFRPGSTWLLKSDGRRRFVYDDKFTITNIEHSSSLLVVSDREALLRDGEGNFQEETANLLTMIDFLFPGWPGRTPVLAAQLLQRECP